MKKKLKDNSRVNCDKVEWTSEKDAAFSKYAKERFEAFLKRLPIRFPDGLPRHFLEDLEYFLDDHNQFAANGYVRGMSNNDKKLHSDALNELRANADFFYSTIETISDDEARASLAFAINRIVYAAADLGKFSGSLPDFSHTRVNSLRLKAARDAKAIKNPDMEKRKNLLRDETDANLKDLTIWKIASSQEGQLNTKCAEREIDGVSAKTWQRYALEVLKERGISPPDTLKERRKTLRHS
jgi:hypothetical protein